MHYSLFLSSHFCTVSMYNISLHKCWTWLTTFTQSLHEPQSKQARAQQMETTKRQVHTGIQTDGHMKRSTCFWHRTSTPSVWFGVEKTTGEFISYMVTRHLTANGSWVLSLFRNRNSRQLRGPCKFRHVNSTHQGYFCLFVYIYIKISNVVSIQAKYLSKMCTESITD